MLNKRFFEQKYPRKVKFLQLYILLLVVFLVEIVTVGGGENEEGGNKIRETNNLLKTFNQFIWKDVTNLDVHWSFFQLLLLLLLPTSFLSYSIQTHLENIPTHQSFKWEFLRNKDFSFFCLGFSSFSSPSLIRYSHHDTQGNSFE